MGPSLVSCFFLFFFLLLYPSFPHIALLLSPSIFFFVPRSHLPFKISQKMPQNAKKTLLNKKRNSSRLSSRSTAPTAATPRRPRPTTAQISSASTFWRPSRGGSTAGSGSAPTGTRSATTGELVFLFSPLFLCVFFLLKTSKETQEKKLTFFLPAPLLSLHLFLPLEFTPLSNDNNKRQTGTPCPRATS